jgi:hypothetical protein
VIKTCLCTWWLQHTSFLPNYMAQSDCLAADRQGHGDTRFKLTPFVIPNSNYVIMVSDWNCLKYFCVFLYCNNQAHRDFLITPFNVGGIRTTVFHWYYDTKEKPKLSYKNLPRSYLGPINPILIFIELLVKPRTAQAVSSRYTDWATRPTRWLHLVQIVTLKLICLTVINLLEPEFCT